MNVQVAGRVSFDPPDFFHSAISLIDDVPTTQLLVGGKWQPAASGERFDVRSPVDGSVIARTAKASSEDVEAAIAAARDTRQSFRGLPAAARLEICEHAAQILEQYRETFVDA
ncbi:MAG TPA: aldehyde dehydrogenase family protein, partial [Acidimicrobiales bacterium]|nr:aldehyde dehydrogenase family protein [Acidimicrobiales bacterium]